MPWPPCAADVPTSCTIVGDGPERHRLLALAGQLGIERNVTVLGRVPDERVAGLLRASRTLALPSEREGFGISVVEGAGGGERARVARGPHSAAPELIRDGEDGIVCEPNAGRDGSCAGDLARRRAAAMSNGARCGAICRASELGRSSARHRGALPTGSAARQPGPAGCRVSACQHSRERCHPRLARHRDSYLARSRRKGVRRCARGDRTFRALARRVRDRGRDRVGWNNHADRRTRRFRSMADGVPVITWGSTSPPTAPLTRFLHSSRCCWPRFRL